MKQEICSVHQMHCAAGCILKMEVEDGRLSRITSAGDIMRDNSRDEDESLFPMQRRACCRGYGEIDHNQSPDRLGYPLLQRKERGNPLGFCKISWDEAIERAADFYRLMKKEESRLSYLPVCEKGGISPYLGTGMTLFGNSSSGNLEAAVYAALGDNGQLRGQQPIDLFNTNYLIIWSNDPTRSLHTLALYS